MSLRVDIVCGTYPPDRCGVADYTRRLCAGLRDLGVDARVVTTCGLDAHADPAVPADCLAKDWGVRSAFALARNLAEREPDIVHIQFPAYRYHGHWGIHVLPALMSRRGVPVITTLHEYCMAPWGGRLKQLLNVGFSRRVIVTNAQDRELIGRWMTQERLDLIPIGSNIPLTGTREHGKEMLHSLGVPAGNDVALFFGFVRPGKGVETLLRACAAAMRARSLSVTVVCPDPEVSYRKSLQDLMEGLGIASDVFWAGYREGREASSLLLASDVVVLPFEDGATMRRGSLLAALTHGRPVVTTRSRATPREFRHGVNMMLARPGNHQELAQYLRAVLEDATLREQVTAGARELGRAFDWRRICAATVAVYERTLEEGHLGRKSHRETAGGAP